VKIEWLNDTLDAARLTKGIWWWKQCADVARDAKGVARDDSSSLRINWRYASGDWCEIELDADLDAAMTREIKRRRAVAHEQRNWKPAAKVSLPEARLLQGDS
jgi:hypothetical protein